MEKKSQKLPRGFKSSKFLYFELMIFLYLELVIFFIFQLKKHGQVFLGKLKTLVNKFLGLNRIYGLIYVIVFTLHTLTGFQNNHPEHRWISETRLKSKNLRKYSVELVQDFLLLRSWLHCLLLGIQFLVKQYHHCSYQVRSQATMTQPTKNEKISHN